MFTSMPPLAAASATGVPGGAAAPAPPSAEVAPVSWSGPGARATPGRRVLARWSGARASPIPWTAPMPCAAAILRCGDAMACNDAMPCDDRMACGGAMRYEDPTACDDAMRCDDRTAGDAMSTIWAHLDEAS